MLAGLVARALIASGARAERAGRLAQACARYRAAARVAPHAAAPQLNLGAALEAAGDAAGAQQAYAAALAAEPGSPFAHFNLGRLAFARGEREVAERALRAAIDAKPDFAEAWIALANALEARGDTVPAVQALQRGLAVAPRHAGAWYNLGGLLYRAEQHDDAEDALRRALELEPGRVSIHTLLARVLRSGGRLREALDALAAARGLAPGRFDLESAELLTLTLDDALSAVALFERQRAFGARLEAAVAPLPAPFEQSADPERRLRVGYLSCDFCRHPVAWFVLPLLERHDRARVEVVCYSTRTQAADPVTAQLRAAANAWYDVGGLDDASLAQQVRRDQVDVLIDLTGHAGELRLGVFARCAAPVQLSWLGYLGSTGLTRIGYRLTDARADPPGHADQLHVESLVRLPVSQWCYRPLHEEAHGPVPPCLSTGYVTFGSFNHAAKLTDTALRCWAEVLRRLPQARLSVVGVPAGRAQARLARRLADLGVEQARLSMRPRLEFGAFLQELDRVDIAFDSLPYGGGTTTFDTLWMGVPVLTLAGERSAGRSAASILAALQLDDWVAADPGEFVRRALAHAGDGPRLAALRATLRARLRASALMDETGFTRAVEAAYRSLWRDWCDGAVS